MLNKIYRSDAFILSVLTTLSFVLIYFFKVNALIAGEKDWSTYNIIRDGLALKASIHDTMTHPWTLLSYLFYTEDFVVLLVDLFWLWIFGTVLSKQYGERSMLALFLVGGILGGITFLLFPHPIMHQVLGMPAALVAVALASFLSQPRFEFQVYTVKVPLWLLTLFFFLIKLLTIPTLSWHYLAWLSGGLVAALCYRYVVPGFFQFFSRWMLRMEERLSNKRFLQTKH